MIDFTPLVQSILAPITQLSPGEQDKERRWRVAMRAIISMLKSWTGVIALASDQLVLNAIVDALSLPSSALRV